jgi:hypothetical protein
MELKHGWPTRRKSPAARAAPEWMATALEMAISEIWTLVTTPALNGRERGFEPPTQWSLFCNQALSCLKSGFK